MRDLCLRADSTVDESSPSLMRDTREQTQLRQRQDTPVRRAAAMNTTRSCASCRSRHNRVPTFVRSFVRSLVRSTNSDESIAFVGAVPDAVRTGRVFSSLIITLKRDNDGEDKNERAASATCCFRHEHDRQMRRSSADLHAARRRSANFASKAPSTCSSVCRGRSCERQGRATRALRLAVRPTDRLTVGIDRLVSRVHRPVT
jgi:hypothetical protein